MKTKNKVSLLVRLILGLMLVGFWADTALAGLTPYATTDQIMEALDSDAIVSVSKSTGQDIQFGIVTNNYGAFEPTESNSFVTMSNGRVNGNCDTIDVSNNQGPEPYGHDQATIEVVLDVPAGATELYFDARYIGHEYRYDDIFEVKIDGERAAYYARTDYAWRGHDVDFSGTHYWEWYGYGMDTGWIRHTIDIAEKAGEQVTLSFAVSDEGNWWQNMHAHLDNINFEVQDVIPAILVGTVSNIVNAGSISGAEVVVNPGNFTAVTDGSGNYRIEELPAGQYNIVVTRDNYRTSSKNEIALRSGYVKDVDFYMAPISEKPLEIASTTNIISVGQTVNMAAVGGNPPYTWTSNKFAAVGGGFVYSYGGNMVIWTANQAGEYTITVTDDTGATADYDITVNQRLTVTPNYAYVEKDTTADLTASGGDGNYQWEAIGGSLSDTSGSTVTFTASNIGGVIPVSVTDGTGMTATAVLSIEQWDVTATPSQLVLFPGELTTLHGAGGSGEYLWDADNGEVTYTYGNGSSAVYEAPLTNGTYTITLTDTAEASDTVTVTVVRPVSVTPRVAALSVGEDVELKAVDGYGTKSWEALLGSLSSTTGDSVTYTASNLTTGMYPVYVMDQNNFYSASLISVGLPLIVSPSKAIINKGGTIDFYALNGRSPYTWSAVGGTLDANEGESVTFTAGNIAGGAMVSVTDNSGKTVTANIVIPSPVTVSPTTALLTPGQEKVFTVTGGTGEIVWSADKGSVSPMTGTTVTYTAPNYPGVVELTAVDGAGVQVIAGITVVKQMSVSPSEATIAAGDTVTLNATGATGEVRWAVEGKGSVYPLTGTSTTYTAPSIAGSYIVKATDDAGDEFTVNIEVTPPVEAFGLSPNSANLDMDGEYVFSITGGTSPYIVKAANGSAVIDGESVKYIAPGYPSEDLVTIYDATGKKATASIAVGSMMMVAVKDYTVARGVTLELSASGGVGTLSWTAEAGGTFVPADGNKGNKVTFKAPDELGDYTVTVTDSALTTRTVSIHVENVPVLTPQYDWLGEDHTTTNLTVVGGNGPFQWSTDIGTIDPSPDGTTAAYTAPGVTDQKATVTVEDVSGYTATATIFVDRDLTLGTELFSKQPGDKFQMIAQGGVSPFYWHAVAGQFVDENGNLVNEGNVVTFEVSNILQDDTVTVRDATGAEVSATVYVRQELSFVTQQKNADLGEQVSMQVQGGVPPYNWTSNLDLSSFEITGEDKDMASITAPEEITPSLSQAGYVITLTVTDSAGSETSGSVFVMGPMNVSKTLIEVPLHGSSKFMVFGGTGTYTPFADKGTVDVISEPIGRGVYEYTTGNTTGDDTITIMDGAGTTKTINVSVSSALPPVVSPSEFEATRGTQMTLSVVHGMAPYTWSFDGANGQIEKLEDDGSVVHVTVEGVSEASARLVVSSADDQQGEAKIITFRPLSISTRAATIFPGGSYTFQALGGSGNYQWELNPATGDASQPIAAAVLSVYTGPSTTFRAPDGVKKGTMLISVTDSAGAEVKARISISPMVMTTNDEGEKAEVLFSFDPQDIDTGLVFIHIIGPSGKDFFVGPDTIDGVSDASEEVVPWLDLAGNPLPAIADFAIYGALFPEIDKDKLKALDGPGVYTLDLIIFDPLYQGTEGAVIEFGGTFLEVSGLILGSTSVTVNGETGEEEPDET